MVLELLINPKAAERSPWELFFFGLVYASIAIVLAMWIFAEKVGLVMVFLTTLSCTYLIQRTLRMEERKDQKFASEIRLLREHGKALTFFMFLFLGFTVAFSLWYILAPAETAQRIFGIQIETIESINSAVTGNAMSGAAAFTKIFANNMRVLLFSFIFAIFYGAGAVFILAWNAAVVGTAIGSFARSGLAALANKVGLLGVGHYLATYSLGLLKYMTHGWLEILAYFTAALAGGILSMALVKHSLGSEAFRRTLRDSVDLALLSVLMIVAAAGIEVFITPVLF